MTASPLSWFDRLSCIFDGDATLTNFDPIKPVDSSLLHNSDEVNELCSGLNYVMDGRSPAMGYMVGDQQQPRRIPTMA